MINQKIVVLIRDIINIIEIYQNPNVLDYNNKINSYRKNINEYYAAVNENDSTMFWNYMFNEFSNDPELYTLLVSIIYDCTKNERCLKETIQLLSNVKCDPFWSTGIRQQIEFSLFTNLNNGNNYTIRRELHKKQLIQLEEKIDFDKQYIKFKDRNKNKIVIITNQLLSDYHAPTRNVKEVCIALEKLGFDVLLLVIVEKTNIDNMMQSWHNFTTVNYNEEYTGNFTVEYYDYNISGYQLLVQESSILEMKMLVNKIYDINPLFIWYMGGTSVYSDVFRKITTFISMPFTDGYIVSEAPILIEYMKSNSDKIQEMEAYIKKAMQTTVHFNFEQPIHPSKITVSRDDYHFKKEEFLIGIVGNRLDLEITESFVKVINQILEFGQDIHIVFIGNMQELPYQLKSEAYYLGYQDDLICTVSLIDVFLNPPRQGGGTGAYWSLYNSKPVVTLGDCDVASCVTKDFICDNEDDMIDMIGNLYNDKDYLEKMKKKAKNIIDEIEKNNDICLNIQKLIKQVTEVNEVTQY